MPCVPREEREAYRQWAKDNFKAQMDTRAWVHESDYDEFLRRPPPEEDENFHADCPGCRICDKGWYG